MTYALARALGFAWNSFSRALIGWSHMRHQLTHARQMVRTRKEENLETSVNYNINYEELQLELKKCFITSKQVFHRLFPQSSTEN